MSKAKAPTSSYAVGYGKPPKAHQFKPGQSGNPKGRPKGQPTLSDLVQREATRLVRARVGETVVQVSKLEAFVRKLYGSALEGDWAAARMLLPFMQEAVASQEARGPADSESEELGAIPSEEAIQRILRRFEHLRGDGEEG